MGYTDRLVIGLGGFGENIIKKIYELNQDLEVVAVESSNVETVNSIIRKRGPLKKLFIICGLSGSSSLGLECILMNEDLDHTIVTLIVTKPFAMEGTRRINRAKEQIQKVRQYADNLYVADNTFMSEYYGFLRLVSAFQLVERDIFDIITYESENYENVIYDELFLRIVRRAL